MAVYVTEKSVELHEPWIVHELGFCVTHTNQSHRTLIIIGELISNHEGQQIDLRARANTASVERKAYLPNDERQDGSTKGIRGSY